jgi:hypothetical protein
MLRSFRLVDAIRTEWRFRGRDCPISRISPFSDRHRRQGVAAAPNAVSLCLSTGPTMDSSRVRERCTLAE